MTRGLGTIIEAGVDWLTATGTGGAAGLALYDHTRRLMKKQLHDGNALRPWAMSGYKGFTTGSICLGNREDGCIVRLSSHLAAEHWWEVSEMADHCTRVDTQVTVRTKLDPVVEVTAEYRRAKRFWRGRRDGPVITLWRSSDGGCTLYLGKRTSHWFLRCYNKAAETPGDHYEGCIRYEAEAKGAAARAVIKELSRGPLVQSTIVRNLHHAFLDRGCSPRFPLDNRGSIYALPPTLSSDVVRKLGWLHSSVRPSVQFCLSYVTVDTVLEALGLSGIAVPSGRASDPKG